MKHDYTQDDAASIFEDRYGLEYRFNMSARHWIRWDGRLWRQDVKSEVLDHIRLINRETGDPRLCSAAAIAGVEKIVRTSPQFVVKQSDLDADPLLLGTPSGVVDLRAGTLLPPDPLRLITKATAVTPRRGRPEHFLRFLRDATGGDEELIRYLQAICGYALTGLTTEQCLFFIYGDGGTGKSTFVNILRYILGDYAAVAAMDTFVTSPMDRHPTDLAGLAGARLVLANETEQGRKFAEARIKSLTAGDPVSARFMRGDFFEYLPAFKLFIVGNHMPTLENVDEAMRRRMRIIPFDVKPAVRDSKLMEKLQAEAPEILQWCIEGCLRWQSEGLAVPSRVRAATDAYFTDQDLFGQWFEESLIRTPGESAPKSDVLDSWNRHRREAGENEEKGRQFSPRMSRAGIESGRSASTSKPRGYFWRGIKLIK